VFIPLFFDMSPTIASNQLVNVPRKLGRAATPTWNAHLWDIKS